MVSPSTTLVHLRDWVWEQERHERKAKRVRSRTAGVLRFGAVIGDLYHTTA
jgi:hypothetical protein